jgi:hypothetical protein
LLIDCAGSMNCIDKQEDIKWQAVRVSPNEANFH